MGPQVHSHHNCLASFVPDEETDAASTDLHDDSWVLVSPKHREAWRLHLTGHDVAVQPSLSDCQDTDTPILVQVAGVGWQHVCLHSRGLHFHKQGSRQGEFIFQPLQPVMNITVPSMFFASLYSTSHQIYSQTVHQYQIYNLQWLNSLEKFYAI